MDVLVALTAFAVILPAELPDKTFVATLVLSTRFRPVLVWVGVVLAFGVQTAVAVTAGGLLALLPERAATPATTRGAFAAIGTSFGVLFLAEWGDLSQLVTAGLAARYGEPISVFVGAWLALACVAAIGVLVGRTLLRVVRPSTVRRVAGALFALLAVLAALEALGVDLLV